MARQSFAVVYCQVCGRASRRQDAKQWLVSPHRSRPGLEIVRCPQHWSEWALRNSKAGRTKVMRQRMAEALALPVPPIPAWLGPTPIGEPDEDTQEAPATDRAEHHEAPA